MVSTFMKSGFEGRLKGKSLLEKSKVKTPSTPGTLIRHKYRMDGFLRSFGFVQTLGDRESLYCQNQQLPSAQGFPSRVSPYQMIET